MSDRPFTPAWGRNVVVTNATSATDAVDLPESCEQVLLYNSSATAKVYIYVTSYTGDTPTGAAPVAATTGGGMPVPPGALVRVTVGRGRKVVRTIATAADGNIEIIPGNGD